MDAEYSDVTPNNCKSFSYKDIFFYNYVSIYIIDNWYVSDFKLSSDDISDIQSSNIVLIFYFI